MSNIPYIGRSGTQLVIPIDGIVEVAVAAKEDKAKKGVANGYAWSV